MRSPTRKLWLVGLVILLMGGAAYFSAVSRYSDVQVPLLDGSSVTVVPGVHLIGELGPSVAYVIETPQGLVLVDTGLDDDARILKSKISKLGLDYKSIRAILLTHVHGDHCGGAERLRLETGAQVYAGQADAPVLAAGEPREAFYSTFSMPDHSPHPTTVDVPLQGDETISFGDVRIQILDTPGHTDGSTCYLMQRAGQRIFFSGDVIIRLGQNPLGTYSTYLAPRYRGNARSYLQTLKKLRAIHAPDLVLPGHPDPTQAPQSPRFNQQKWDSMLDNGIREMERLVARYDSDGANFLDGDPKSLLTDLYYFGDFQGVAVYGLVSASKLFLINAPGGPGLDVFLREQQQKLGLMPKAPFAIMLTGNSDWETAGLEELVARHNAQVIASRECLDAVKQRLPSDSTLVTAKDLANEGWFDLTVIPLDGPGVSPVAYLVRWHNKNILLSGRFLDVVDNRPVGGFSVPGGAFSQNASSMIASLRKLAGVQPDLWLPSIPKDGQNANLYGNAWNAKLEKVFRTISQ